MKRFHDSQWKSLLIYWKESTKQQKNNLICFKEFAHIQPQGNNIFQNKTVRDHCNYTNLYSVAAHNNCNLQVVGNKAKGRILKRVFQENKARQIFRKMNIFYPLIRTRTWAYQRVKNVRFLENLACFVFLKHPFWNSPFCLITDKIRL